ncbi:hypothetical protein BJ875DRAFT_546436 [Amylocarpus encephaloides]|uniref:Uncharacterized protein n=1 Tax=Amylocarpus encephaloides TaxID=45428 RepID=A0A9P7YB92_9HELO|nr:hypothetical protein BJ875DRAFT_546436 [Amylocarpus encephaloides]
MPCIEFSLLVPPTLEYVDVDAYRSLIYQPSFHLEGRVFYLGRTRIGPAQCTGWIKTAGPQTDLAHLSWHTGWASPKLPARLLSWLEYCASTIRPALNTSQSNGGGPGSSRAFLSSLSTLYTLPNEDFARLCPDTLSTHDAGFPLADSSKEERTRNPGKGSREVKLEKFIADSGEALLQLVNQHWERLADGLKLRRALSLIRNLRNFQEYLVENGYHPSDTSNHRLRYGYLVYIYAANFNSSDSKRCDIRTALKEDLRYAIRWMIFIDALGLGAVLVCGEAIAKLVYKTSGNTNDDLKWLATKIRQFPTIDFRALCGIFNIMMADLLQHYQVKHPQNKFELMAKIQAVANGSATGGLHHHSDSL